MTDATHERLAPEGAAVTKARIWDPWIRAFHWGLVAAFAIVWLTADEVQKVHEIAGYIIAGLIAFRLIWGLVGSRYARFSQFLRGPKATLSYCRDMALGRERRYLGHNPAGAVMIVALLFTLAATALTGWLIEEPDRTARLPELVQIVPPARADEAGHHDHKKNDTLEDVHEVLANLLLMLVALHVAGVILASVRHRENLARAMVTGKKRAAEAGDIA
ncbi:MAG: cytochrome b/b6 domain-containing protein [Rhodobacteraceae bacterium]|nr:cytochrome b/b6 domain-containing protein [Paracoccaceae bacterium]